MAIKVLRSSTPLPGLGLLRVVGSGRSLSLAARPPLILPERLLAVALGKGRVNGVDPPLRNSSPIKPKNIHGWIFDFLAVWNALGLDVHLDDHSVCDLPGPPDPRVGDAEECRLHLLEVICARLGARHLREGARLEKDVIREKRLERVPVALERGTFHRLDGLRE